MLIFFLDVVLGTVLSLREAGTSCNVTSGLLHYAWNISLDVLLYRQIDVHCYNHKDSVRTRNIYCAEIKQ